jgi:hypothetical protein
MDVNVVLPPLLYLLLLMLAGINGVIAYAAAVWLRDRREARTVLRTWHDGGHPTVNSHTVTPNAYAPPRKD